MVVGTRELGQRNPREVPLGNKWVLDPVHSKFTGISTGERKEEKRGKRTIPEQE